MPRTRSAVGTTLSPAPTIVPKPRSTPCVFAPSHAATPASESRDAATADGGEREPAAQHRRRAGPVGRARAPAVPTSPRRPPRRSGWPAAARPRWRRAGTRRRSTARTKLPCTPNLSSVSLSDVGTIPVVTLAMMPNTSPAAAAPTHQPTSTGELEPHGRAATASRARSRRGGATSREASTPGTDVATRRPATVDAPTRITARSRPREHERRGVVAGERPHPLGPAERRQPQQPPRARARSRRSSARRTRRRRRPCPSPCASRRVRPSCEVSAPTRDEHRRRDGDAQRRRAAVSPTPNADVGIARRRAA